MYQWIYYYFVLMTDRKLIRITEIILRDSDGNYDDFSLKLVPVHVG